MRGWGISSTRQNVLLFTPWPRLFEVPFGQVARLLDRLGWQLRWGRKKAAHAVVFLDFLRWHVVSVVTWRIRITECVAAFSNALGTRWISRPGPL